MSEQTIPEQATGQAVEQWYAVMQFLFLEARLLDEQRLDEWLDLFTDDAVYWVPLTAEHPDPRHDVSLVFDDRRRMRERVLRLSTGFAYSQEPPSRTCHHVSGVTVFGQQGDVLEVQSSLVVSEVRRGKQSLYAGRTLHELVPTEGAYRIQRKTVWLVQSELFLGNVTFLL